MHALLLSLSCILFKAGRLGEECLPPNADALTQHTKKCSFQAFIWRHSLNPIIDLPSLDMDGMKTVRVKFISNSWPGLLPQTAYSCLPIVFARKAVALIAVLAEKQNLHVLICASANLVPIGLTITLGKV